MENRTEGVRKGEKRASRRSAKENSYTLKEAVRQVTDRQGYIRVRKSRLTFIRSLVLSSFRSGCYFRPIEREKKERESDRDEARNVRTTPQLGALIQS